MAAAEIDVEVVHVSVPPVLRVIRVPAGATVLEVISRSGLAKAASLELRHGGVGIFGRRVGLGDPVHAGDRIEIYENLPADPKARRRVRAREARLSRDCARKSSGA